jgi:hypothetical protein
VFRPDNDKNMKPAVSLERRGLKTAVAAPGSEGVAFRYGLAVGPVTVATAIAVLTWDFDIQPEPRRPFLRFALILLPFSGYGSRPASGKKSVQLGFSDDNMAKRWVPLD